MGCFFVGCRRAGAGLLDVERSLSGRRRQFRGAPHQLTNARDATTTDHGAKLLAAIADARHVFEGQKVAEDVLHYLEQVLAAGAPVPAGGGWVDDAGKPLVFGAASMGSGAPVPAQTGTEPGAENASIAKQTHTPLGATPRPVAGSEWPDWARDLDKLAGDVKQIEVATGSLFSELANILGTVGADTFDQAAAAMAAESAEKVADAERSVAARATVSNDATPTIVSRLVVEVDTTQLDAALAKAEQLKVVLAVTSASPVALVELACQVRNEALDIGQPVDITLQLLTLVEQRRTNELLRTAHDEVKWARTRYEQSQRQFS